uniref:Gustatory receptor n=1 Tax=Tetranychus urticae TaxID=32264 RepID=T1KAL8_TETUR
MYRITTLDGRSSCSKPIGLLASMLQFEGRKSKLTHFVFNCVLIYINLHDIWLFNTKTKLEMCFETVYLISLNVLLFWSLRLNSNKGRYIELIGTFEDQTRCNLDNAAVYHHFASIRNIFRISLVSAMIFFTFAIIYNTIMTFRKSDDYVQLGEHLLLGLADLICILCFQFYNQFLVESCLHIHACWLTVNEHVRSLDNIESRVLNIYKVRQVRSMYSIAAVITEKMDSFLRIPLFNFYSYFITSSFDLMAQVWSLPTVFGFIGLLIRVFTMTLIIYSTIHIHYLSNKCFDDVYSLSYKVRSTALDNEVQLFLDRISQSVVGFSFLKISLITPTFVTAWSSTMLAFVLSLPSLF